MHKFPSVVANVDLSSSTRQDLRSISYNITTDERILPEIIFTHKWFQTCPSKRFTYNFHVKNVKKLKDSMLLVKTIIVFTSIYFESYCKIPARSNKSIQ